MEVQRVRPTWRVRARDRERELDCRILGEHVHAAVWKELRRGARPTQDLQQHGHRRRRERRAVDEVVLAVDPEVQVQRVVHPAHVRLPGGGRAVERDQVRLDEGGGAGRLVRAGLDGRGTCVAQDCRVDPAVESRSALVGERTDPVVACSLVRGEDERVALPCEDLDGVDRERRVVDRIGLDDGHGMAVDGEGEVGIAREGDEAEAVALALRDGDDGEIRRIASGKAAETVY